MTTQEQFRRPEPEKTLFFIWYLQVRANAHFFFIFLTKIPFTVSWQTIFTLIFDISRINEDEESKVVL